MSFAVYHKLSGEKGLYMWLSRYFVYFIIFSCMGWIYESIYCTIRAKKWENRGFLYGPLCPIYGAGGVAITAIADFISAHTDATFTWWQIFLVAFLGSIVLEYGTSWALEKLFHAYWWDYSSMPLNINGRVCFPYSVGFGVAGLIVVYFIAPFTKLITGWMSPIWMRLWKRLKSVRRLQTKGRRSGHRSLRRLSRSVERENVSEPVQTELLIQWVL